VGVESWGTTVSLRIKVRLQLSDKELKVCVVSEPAIPELVFEQNIAEMKSWQILQKRMSLEGI
jgi:hypothetical protein